MNFESRIRKRESRDEIAAKKHEALLEAALRAVSRYGYSKSSVSRITAEAGVAQGTLYTYFGSHQALLEMLLPLEGERLLAFLADHARGASDYFAMERQRFLGLLSYLDERPYIMRLLMEAEIAAPLSFERHMRAVEQRYLKALPRAQARGEIRPLKRREFEAIAEILVSSRAQIAICQHALTQTGSHRRRELEARSASVYVRFLRTGIGAAEAPGLRAIRATARPRRRADRGLRTALFEAAGQLIEELGFAGTTVKGITQRAGVAIGTFYSHFESRDHFLEAMLIHARRALTSYISIAVKGSGSFAEMEIRGFKAFSDALEREPWLVRILLEAAVWAPEAYQRYLFVILRGYRRAMVEAKGRGELADYDADELEMLAATFMGARHFAARRHFRGAAGPMPFWVINAYAQLLCGGLASEALRAG